MESFKETVKRKLQTREEGRRTLGDDLEGYFSGLRDDERSIAADERLYDLQMNLFFLKELATLNANQKLVSHGSIKNKAIVFIKKLIMRCLKWYIDPVNEQQSKYNKHNNFATSQAGTMLCYLIYEVQMLRDENNKLHGEMNALKRRLNIADE